MVHAPTTLALYRATRPPHWLPLVGRTNLKDASTDAKTRTACHRQNSLTRSQI
ncbi:hypothetical protein [Nostoc sp.]|uniref:hypothetical protein n=1 Tax=Nostoc sp. TaxID=1180 RepID=UPI002FF74356